RWCTRDTSPPAAPPESAPRRPLDRTRVAREAAYRGTALPSPARRARQSGRWSRCRELQFQAMSRPSGCRAVARALDRFNLRQTVASLLVAAAEGGLA